MKAACYLIAAAAELTACMKYSIYDSCRRNAFLRVDTRGYASTVVIYFNNITGKYIDLNFGTKSCKSLIYRIINYLIDKVMETPGTR